MSGIGSCNACKSRQEGNGMNTDKNKKNGSKKERASKKKPVIDGVMTNSQKMENTTVQTVTNGHIKTFGYDVSSADCLVDAIDAVNTLPYKVNGITDCSLPDETVLYSPECEMVISLNSSAKAIWELCDGSRTIVEISQELGKRLGYSGTELLSDVITAICEFQKLSFLELKNVVDTELH